MTYSNPILKNALVEIVADCLGEKPSVTDPGCDAFASIADFVRWCMEGSAGDQARAALKASGNYDLDDFFLTEVEERIEAAADIKGLAWINDGLVAREHDRPMDGHGNYAD